MSAADGLGVWLLLLWWRCAVLRQSPCAGGYKRPFANGVPAAQSAGRSKGWGIVEFEAPEQVRFAPGHECCVTSHLLFAF